MNAAITVMDRLGVADALVGDLLEQRRQGRSALWFWWQTVAAIVLTATRDVRLHPLLIIRAIVLGWAALMLLFTLVGDRTADTLAHLLWGWTRTAGYGDGIWWPFRITAGLTSYCGFGLAAWVVARQDRGHAAAGLL